MISSRSFRKTRCVTYRPASFTDLEHVPGTAHGMDVARLFRITFYFLPKTANIHVHNARGHESSVVPNSVEEGFSGKYPPGMRREEFDEAQLGGVSDDDL